MNKHAILSFPLFLLLIFFLKGCQQEEIAINSSIGRPVRQETRAMTYPPSGGFFESDGVDENLNNIIVYLKEINDSTAFTNSFIENYGYPLWENNYQFPHEDKIVYVVPVINEKEIETIWFFEMSPTDTRYYVFPRPEDNNSLSSLGWMFDYFNVALSLYIPENEGEIIQFTAPETRAYIMVEYCNDIYTGYIDSNGVELLEYSYTHCWTEYFYIWDGFGGGGGDGGDGGDGGGGLVGGGGSGGTLPVSPNGNLTALFLSTSELGNDAKDKLKDAVDDIRDNCYSEAIYNYLVNSGIKFSNVEIDPTLWGQGGLDRNSGRLRFQRIDDINFTTFYHEMFHLFQRSEGVYTGESVVGMMEYERTLFEDIAFTIQHMVDGEIPLSAHYIRKSQWVYGDKKKDEQDKYMSWLEGITQKGKSYPSSISSDDFKKWAIFFGEGNRRYGQYNYTIEYDPKVLVKAIALINNHCGK